MNFAKVLLLTNQICSSTVYHNTEYQNDGKI